MFIEHFNLTEQPFGATPDPRFLFQTGSHREALASLYTGFYGNRGFTVLTAEPGMGKTTLLFEFLDHIRDRAKTVFLFNTLCEAKDVLSLILQDLGVSPGATLAKKHRQLNDVLVAEARSGRPVVLVVDEAQNLSTEALEAVRLLTNFETAQSKLMQIVLAGQPQLADKLARPEIAQLLQRVSTMCRLVPFSPTDTAAYIDHRLKVAGHTGKPLFTSGALDLVADASRGVPRVINTLCFNSLCLCRARDSKVVDDDMVKEAIRDLQLPLTQPIPATQQTDDKVAVVTPFAEFSEVRVSSGKTARYITAALLAACLGGIGVFWSGAGARMHLPFPVPAGFSHIQNAPVTKAKAEISAPSPVPSPASDATHTQTMATAPSTIAMSSNTVIPVVTDKDDATEYKTVTVGPGDTLVNLAMQNVGGYNGAVLQQIRALNPSLKDPNHIETGRTIRLPESAATTTSDVPARNKP